MTTENIDIVALKEVFAKIDYLKDRWCDIDLDFPDEITAQTPDFLRWAYSKMGIALGILPEPELKIISAVYGANETWMDVKNILEANIQEDVLKMDINNMTMKKDICPGILKTLKLVYTMSGVQNILDIKEGTGVWIEDMVKDSV
jgi:hypothetical protein